MATDEYAMDIECVVILQEIIAEHGRVAALSIWEHAEADAMAEGASGISAARMREAWRQYEAQE